MEIWYLLEHKILYAEKIHMGGIEGLVWKKNLLCSCSSDNTINIINTDQSIFIMD
jgi:hypothetical protein